MTIEVRPFGWVLKEAVIPQVAVLPIDVTGLENMTGNETLGSQLSELISDSTKVTDEPGEPVVAANADEAAASPKQSPRLRRDGSQ